MIPSVPPNPDGSCPAGSHNAGGSPGNAGQPGTGSVVCIKNVPVETAPPATPPSNTPPAQPSQPQQVCGPNAGGAACDAAKAAANCPADATLSTAIALNKPKYPQIQMADVLKELIVWEALVMLVSLGLALLFVLRMFL